MSEKRSPIPAKAGRRERFDYEYQRNGTRNLFMTCAPLAGWRHVAVTGRRTMTDFAHQMRWLADAAYPEAEKIRVVLDNLNTHRPASLTRLPVRGLRAQGGQTGDPTAGVSLYSPAWELAQSCPELAEGMAEIEFSVFSNQCLNRRIEDEAALKREIAALETERNQAAATIDWRFSTTNARHKLRRIYPSVSH